MSSYSRHGSYSEKVLAARKRRKTVGEIVLVLLILAFVRSFLLQSYRIDDNSMLPGLQKGDHVFSSPFLHGPDFFGMRLPALSKPYRGEMVLVRSSSDPHASGWSRFWDSILRFFSFQRYSPLDRAYGDGQ
ncbi:MAG: S26 family signal peptidase, partial [Spirochaetaceae bacterium]|nr:S26 family signal peptidase [Spirochaetaceae bacterium]